jgi:DUF177 domain-containing protein
LTLDVDVRDLLGHPGSHRTVRVEEPVEGLRTELAHVPEDAPVAAELLMESVVEGILASGPVAGTMRLTCARCLKPFDASFQIEVRELFTPAASEGDEEYPVQEGFVDLTPMIRDNVVPVMPFAPLCRQDCLGLCPRCGGDRNLGECSCSEPVDERWSALADLDLRLEEEEGEE